MPEMVSAVASLKPPWGFDGKWDEGYASCLAGWTMGGEYSGFRHEQCMSLIVGCGLDGGLLHC